MKVNRPGCDGLLTRWTDKAREAVVGIQWKNVIVYPFVFAVFPILSLYVENMGQGFLREALLMAASVLVCALLFWLAVGLLVKDRNQSAIIVSAFFVLLFSYGHVVSAFTVVVERLDLLGKTRYLLDRSLCDHCSVLVWACVLVAVVGVVVRIKSNLRSVTKFLNVVALALALMVAGSFSVRGISLYLPLVRAEFGPDLVPGDSGRPKTDLSFRVFLPFLSRNSPEKDTEDERLVREFIASWQDDVSGGEGLSGSSPDIYYIIVDAYARADILEEIYALDNSEFVSYLTEKGFYVADESIANYAQSALSFSSSLNFTYLDALVEQIGAETSNRQPLQVMIEKSRVFRYFRDRGYTFVVFSSGYGPTDITDADMYMEPPQGWKLSEFQEAVIMLTPLSAFPELRSDPRRNRIVYAFNRVPDATEVDGPVFVFAHITAPHFPFIFDAEGNPVQPPRGIGNREDYEYDEYIEGYRNQLLYVTKMLRMVVDEILSRSTEPPIIILQSDHGPCAQLAPGWNVEETYLAERMSILNAYHFPRQDYETLYEQISPVNTFRVVLNEYFGTDHDLLEDRSYFSSWGRPYLFTDVTDEVLTGQ